MRRIQDFRERTLAALVDLNGPVTDAEQKLMLDDYFREFFKEIDDADPSKTESSPPKKSIRQNP